MWLVQINIFIDIVLKYKSEYFIIRSASNFSFQ
jgi:hypothetical protein